MACWREFYAGLGMLWLILIAAGALFLGKKPFLLMRYVREPVLITFSTATSDAACRVCSSAGPLWRAAPRLGFVLPLGYAFNLDGSMMYTSFASLFIAQAYGIHLSLEQQVLML
jgi:Na+/H+-dicarboxylate symporter